MLRGDTSQLKLLNSLIRLKRSVTKSHLKVLCEDEKEQLRCLLTVLLSSNTFFQSWIDVIDQKSQKSQTKKKQKDKTDK